MPKRSLIEQLDNAVQVLLANQGSDLPKVDASLEPLLRIAAELRNLPRQAFRAELKRNLQPGGPVDRSHDPREFHGVAPYLVFRNAARAIEFYKRVFGAVERFRLTELDGKVGHAEIVIGESTLKLSDEYPEYGARSPESYGGSPVRLHLYVADVDAVAKHAVEEGATVVRPVQDQFYGDRSGQLADPFGYLWTVSTHKEDVAVEELQRRFRALAATSTAEKKVSPIPEGFRTVTPYLVVNQAAELIDFVKEAFGAEERFRSIGSAGGIHCEVKLGDSIMMIGGGENWTGTPMPTAIHLYVRDVDATYQRALQAGAVSLYEPKDQPYGDREGGVRDQAGNFWYIGTNKQTGAAPEGLNTITACLHLKQPLEFLEFIKRAFGAEEMHVSQSPRGTLQHAKMRLGTSVLEVGPAHGAYQPMPTMFYLYVTDVDALYQQAIAAGGSSISAPADQPYGDRNAGVQDPFGNQWYIATHVKDVSN